MCLNGNNIAGIVLNKRGVSWGHFHDLIVYGGVNYGIYEDVAATPTHSDQETEWDHIQTLCSQGECWTTGPGAWISGGSVGVDVTSNYYRHVVILPSGSATGGFHCNGGDGNTFYDFFGASPPGIYDFIAGPGTTNSPYSDACRENFFFGNSIFSTGFHAVASGALHSYGNLIVGFKAQDSGPMAVDNGAELTWFDTLGNHHSIASETNRARITLGSADSSEASLEINEQYNGASVAKFGSLYPLYAVTANPGFGFNEWWNGTNWIYGDGSSSSWAATYIFDHALGTLWFAPAAAAGNAGGTVTNANAIGFSNKAELLMQKKTASNTAPGAGLLKFQVVAGTTGGTCKIIAYAGTSTTPVTIVDNVGGGC
jgi:hypothetical protein